jgi:hypothetical protein
MWPQHSNGGMIEITNHHMQGAMLVDRYVIATSMYGLSGSSPGRIGLYTHELGHAMGLPDLYDVDLGVPLWIRQRTHVFNGPLRRGARRIWLRCTATARSFVNATDSDAGSGLGNFDLMANAWGMDDSLLYPPPLSAWSKIKLGWVMPIEISETGYITIEPASEAKVSRG